MKPIRKIGKVIVPFAQWTAYKIVIIVGLTFALAAFLIGFSPFFMDEAGRQLLKQHWLLSGMTFMAINLGAMAFLFLKRHIEHRWPHVIHL